jgi:hypothetical protein
MRHRVTIETKGLLEAIDHIRQRVQSRLDAVSPEAREEWGKMLLAVPAGEDVMTGVIDVSTETLSQMIAKASRFEQILKSTVGSGPMLAQPRGGLAGTASSDEPRN